MADAGRKPENPLGRADTDSPSVDTLLEGVLASAQNDQKQAAAARAPRKPHQETPATFSVMLDDEADDGPAQRRKPFLPESEQVARAAMTVPSLQRKNEFANDTEQMGVPSPTPGQAPSAALKVAALLGGLIALSAGGVYYSVHRTSAGATETLRLTPLGSETRTVPAGSTASLAMSLSSPSATAAPTKEPPSGTATSFVHNASVPSGRPTSQTPTPPSTYGHLVPGGRQ